MSRNGIFCLFSMILSIVILTSACISPAEREKQEISNLIIRRCSKAWRDLPHDEDSVSSPQNCVWQYKQYNDRQEFLMERDFKTPELYIWLPKSGYIISIGRILMLYDSEENMIGYYADSDYYELNYSYSGTITSEAYAQAVNEGSKAYFTYIMAFQAITAFSVPNKSFADYDFSTDKGYCVLTEEQISQIKRR